MLAISILRKFQLSLSPEGTPGCLHGRGRFSPPKGHETQNRIARLVFYIDKKSRMVLLHGFIKKTQKTPKEDLELARRNKTKHQLGLE